MTATDGLPTEDCNDRCAGEPCVHRQPTYRLPGHGHPQSQPCEPEHCTGHEVWQMLRGAPGAQVRADAVRGRRMSELQAELDRERARADAAEQRLARIETAAAALFGEFTPRVMLGPVTDDAPLLDVHGLWLVPDADDAGKVWAHQHGPLRASVPLQQLNVSCSMCGGALNEPELPSPHDTY